MPWVTLLHLTKANGILRLCKCGDAYDLGSYVLSHIHGNVYFISSHSFGVFSVQ